MYWGHHYWGMHVFWWFFWILVVIGIMYWLRPIEIKRRDTAIETLRRSYAAGSITEEEYRHRLEVLTERDKGPTQVAGDASTHAPPDGL